MSYDFDFLSPPALALDGCETLAAESNEEPGQIGRTNVDDAGFPPAVNMLGKFLVCEQGMIIDLTFHQGTVWA